MDMILQALDQGSHAGRVAVSAANPTIVGLRRSICSGMPALLASAHMVCTVTTAARTWVGFAARTATPRDSRVRLLALPGRLALTKTVSAFKQADRTFLALSN